MSPLLSYRDKHEFTLSHLSIDCVHYLNNFNNIPKKPGLLFKSCCLLTSKNFVIKGQLSFVFFPIN
ncbi:hypothetical protein Mgra_00004574 [Meloidogyne graminicola]|uniref:Uncharacterized protein n=1 Tax=Meloidogyne graminicola TaxID=189291 RepID=A0A8S9ZS00_9BILA|nr:hypothetical protein Mgra_00004574 [Meloidogyne graminicola]